MMTHSIRLSAAAAIALTLGGASLLAESAAGVAWTAPAGWTRQAPRPMREATYVLAPEFGEKSGGECGVYFFGAGQGGSVDDNLARWKGQFTVTGGGPAPAKVAKRSVHGLAMTTIDVSGDYSGLGGPLSDGGGKVGGYRLLGAIVTAPGGNIFIKCTGPLKTMSVNQPKFEQLLSSFQPVK
jgi:hypothetical protein